MTIETVWLDTAIHVNPSAAVSSTVVLGAGTEYVLEVDGNFSWWINESVPFGAADTILYPSPTQALRPASMDADTYYADIIDRPVPVHQGGDTSMLLDLGSGFSHVEPDGGPYSSPQPNHAYTYTVIGQGSVLRGCLEDAPAGTPNGQIRIQITIPSGLTVGFLQMLA